MANAIPVHSKPAKAAPEVDANGVELPGDYIATVRENLGDPADFARKPRLVRELADGTIETQW
jgi:hypothetical protein